MTPRAGGPRDIGDRGKGWGVVIYAGFRIPQWLQGLIGKLETNLGGRKKKNPVTFTLFRGTTVLECIRALGDFFFFLIRDLRYPVMRRTGEDLRYPPPCHVTPPEDKKDCTLETRISD